MFFDFETGTRLILNYLGNQVYQKPVDTVIYDFNYNFFFSLDYRLRRLRSLKACKFGTVRLELFVRLNTRVWQGFLRTTNAGGHPSGN